jgi:hypothetical protein
MDLDDGQPIGAPFGQCDGRLVNQESFCRTNISLPENHISFRNPRVRWWGVGLF